MNLLFIISGIILVIWTMTFSDIRQRMYLPQSWLFRMIFQFGCMACGGALIMSVFTDNPVDWYSYMFFMAFPIFVFFYMFSKEPY